MKKTIRLSIITLICVLMMFQPWVVNAQASVTDAEKIATQTDAQEQSYPEVQPSETEEIRVEQEMGQVSLTDIQTMDMGRYVIVGVDQPQRKNVSYRWQVYDFSTGSWTVVHEWTTATCVFWVPTHTGDYNLYVQAMSNGQVVSSYAKLHYFSGCVTTLKNISFQEGKGVCSYNVAYDTNDTELKFCWQAYDVSRGSWQTIRDWASESAGNWVPSHDGDYFLYVQAKGGDGKVSSQLLVCHVDAPHITSFTQNAMSGYVNENMVLRGSYVDPTSSVGKEQYLVFDGTYWNKVPAQDGYAAWYPTREGSYLLCYEIYDKNGNRIEQKFQPFTIRTPYVRFGDMQISQMSSLKYKIQANIDTNDVNVQYQWLYYDVANNMWSQISDWSNTTSIDWTADGERYYWIQVRARLRDGTITTCTKGIVATKMPTEQEKMLNLANTYASATNYLILVNGETHKVGVFSGSRGNWKLEYYWDCSDGKKSTPTVRGVFTVAAKGYYFDSGDARCFYYTQFYGDYLFHSVLYDKKTGNLADGRLGMGLSHGCVRLKIENAKWIYDHIPAGTKVVVYN